MSDRNLVDNRSYNDSVRVPAFVVAEFLPTAKAAGTDVDPVAVLASLVCAFDANRVGEVAAAGVTFNL